MPDLNLGRPGLSVLPLGVGDAFSAIHYPTCLLVSRYQNPAWDDDLILIDCPQGIRKMMREADGGRFNNLDLHRVGTLILTHLHADHAAGLETIAAFFRIVVQRPLRLIALPEVLEGIPPLLTGIRNLGTMRDFFEIIPLEPSPAAPLHLLMGRTTKACLAFRRTVHSTPTAAFRLSVGKQLLSYSSDTSFDEGLWEWLWEWLGGMNPSLVIHEVGHGAHTNVDDLYPALGYPEYRNESREALRETLKAQLRTRTLRLIHYPDDLFPLLERSGFPLMREGKLEVL